MNITVSALVLYIVCGNMVLDQRVCPLFFFSRQSFWVSVCVETILFIMQCSLNVLKDETSHLLHMYVVICCWIRMG
jgi:hypothetical protein